MRRVLPFLLAALALGACHDSSSGGATAFDPLVTNLIQTQTTETGAPIEVNGRTFAFQPKRTPSTTSSRPTAARWSSSPMRPGLPSAALLALALPLAAHDHWIAPSSFAPAAGERVDLHLRVGHPSAYEEQPRDPRRSVRFELHGPDGVQPILGLDGRSPAGILRARTAGLATVVYQSDHAFVEIEPAKYAQYLAEEGLDEIAAERAQRGEDSRPGRDSYLRCDKALLLVGGESEARDRRFGLPLELVLESGAHAWSPGDELVVRLEFQGQPLANRQVELLRLSAPHTTVLARTDAQGVARFTPDSAGPWLASSVHQRRATREQQLEGDWEGFWASLAFELRAREAP